MKPAPPIAVSILIDSNNRLWILPYTHVIFYHIQLVSTKKNETNSISHFLTSSYLLKATKLNIETITLYQKIIIMVSKKRVKLNLEIDIDIPIDLITNRTRIKKVEDGIIKSISKGLYQEGLSFDIKKFNFDIENNKFN